MFARPRPKKSPLPHASKRRKTNTGVEEINFDFDAREDYLTGFHKRKLQRIKAAQEQNAKREREERLLQRKQLREDRRQQLEEHLRKVDELVKSHDTPAVGESDFEDEEPWNGIQDEAPIEVINHEAEYVDEDEDRYTTVTVEAVEVSKDGLRRVKEAGESDDDESEQRKEYAVVAPTTKKKWPKKEKKKKFRYESKAERRITRDKQIAGRKLRAARREGNG